MEQVILVDPQDNPIGVREKVEAHLHAELHRAFSVFVLNADGQLLMQRRAEGKYHTAGLWSNTCDGHPRPGETVLHAAQRRLAEEMGIACPLVERAAFPYRTELGEGLSEHEIDHLLIGRYEGDPEPDPEEVSEWRWMDLQAVAADVEAHPNHYVPWVGIALTYASTDAILAWARALMGTVGPPRSQRSSSGGSGARARPEPGAPRELDAPGRASTPRRAGSQQRGMMGKATAIAHPNIAFIKYWGHVGAALHLPANPSISMVLDCLHTRTTVDLIQGLDDDEVTIDGAPAPAVARARVGDHLDRVRALAGSALRAHVRSESNFPAGAGLASSASAFAALTLAASAAYGLELSTGQLAMLARLGSGSACRSVPAGFVEWAVGPDRSSAARSIAPPDHWALCDCIAVVSTQQKAVSSIAGHNAAPSSPLYAARVQDAALQVPACRRAIEERDLAHLGEMMERDAVMMHAVAMTSDPPIYYWSAETMRVVRAVIDWRAGGLPVYYTIDAGPNVHCLCEAAHREEVKCRLRALPGVEQVLVACPGGGARLTDDHVS